MRRVKIFKYSEFSHHLRLRETFELTNRKGVSTKQWELSELFPSLKTTAEGQETVKVSDCSYPGAKKPLRILSSLFCLNITSQIHISIPFAELVLATLNGHTIDWTEEFYQEFRDEVLKLHHKHSQTVVKMVRTTIGPHLTLLIKAAGAMDLRHEIEAGFHVVKTFGTNLPKRRRHTEIPMPPSCLQSKFQVVHPRTTGPAQDQPSTTLQTQST